MDAQAAAARTEAEAEVQAGMAGIEAEQTRANAEAQRHIDEGRAQAEAEQRRGEEEAERIKQDKEDESGGFFGWVASAAQDFFEGVKRAISGALEAARQAIQSVIEAARDLAMAAIEAARQVIVDTIRAVGDALIAIGDRLLAAFPELRERFRATMQALVDSAVEAVNQIAEGLKAGVQAALDLLARGLEAALNLLEAGLHAIVDGVNAVVQGAIQFAEGVAQAFGVFAVLVKDIATDPGGWLGLLGAAVVDGIQNHLWGALQTAALAWFQSKVLDLLGIGGGVLALLMEDGIDLGQITSMAWEALQGAIPVALIAILVEKLLSMIVPAAGAVMAIVEGMMAAWGAVSRIIAAMNAFIEFLKAVKGGAAGPLFANLLALSAVVVIDFVSNWLLRKLMRAARRIGQRLRQMAERSRQRRRQRRDQGRNERRDQGTDRRRDRDDNETLAQKQARLRRATDDVKELFRRRRRVRPLLRMSLARIKRRHRLRQLRAKRTGSGKTSTYQITAIINPQVKFEATAASDDAATLAQELQDYCQGPNDGTQTAAKTECQKILLRLFPGSGYRVIWKHLSGSECSVTLHDQDGQTFSVGVLQKLRNDGQPVAKTDPDTPHNKKIAEVIEEYTSGGEWKLWGGGQASSVAGGKPERIIDTQGGHKDTRRPDITLVNSRTGEILHINVGLGLIRRRRKEDGSGHHEVADPIKREREAQEDIEGALGPNEQFKFVAYNH